MTARHQLMIEDIPSIAGWVTTAQLARVLGSDDPRAARDWCKSRGVPYERDGKVNWVRVADILRAISRTADNDDAGLDAAIDRAAARRNRG